MQHEPSLLQQRPLGKKARKNQPANKTPSNNKSLNFGS